MTADQAAAPHPPRAVLLGRALRRRNGRGFPGGFVARYGERRSVDLNGLIEEALNLAYHGGRAQDASFNITLERDFAQAIAPIELVPQDITRVCLNLFGNRSLRRDRARRRSRRVPQGMRARAMLSVDMIWFREI